MRPAEPDPLTLCGVAPLMASMSGDPRLVIGLIDGPVAVDHPGLEPNRVRRMTMPAGWRQGGPDGTFVAGVLVGRRGASAPGVCPGCLVVSRPVAGDALGDGEFAVSPNEIGAAIDDCLEAGVRILNISVVLAPAAADGLAALIAALDRAARRGVLVVVAARRRAGRRRFGAGAASVGRAGRRLHPLRKPVAGRALQPASSAPRPVGTWRRHHQLDSPGGLATRSGAAVAVPFVTGAAAPAVVRPAGDRRGCRAARAALHGPGFADGLGAPLMDAWAAFVHLRPLAV